MILDKTKEIGSFIFLTGAVFFILVWNAWAISDKPAKVQLSPEEKSWLEKHPVIKLAPDPEFLPIEYIDENGRYLGIAADFVALLKKKLDLPLQMVALKNWDEVLSKTRAREVDMWGAATPTPQRLKYMSFTRPFIELPAVILVRNKVEKTLTLEKLAGMRVAVISGYGVHDHILNNHPEIKLEVVPDISTGLKKVSFGMVDALVSNIGIATYYIEKEGIVNLRVAGESGFIYQWGLAARNDWPELSRILDKGIQAISEEERKAIYRKWIISERKMTILQFFKSNALLLCALLIVGTSVSYVLLKRRIREKTLDLQSELSRRQQVENLLTGYNEVLASMTRDSNLRVALDILIRVMERQSEGMVCAIMLLDETGEKLLHGAAPSLPNEYTDAVNGVRIGPNVGSCGAAAYNKIPVMVRDIASDPNWKDIKHLALRAGLRACHSTPITGTQGDVLGTFAIYYAEVRDPDPGDLEIVDSSVQIAKLAIERSQVDKELIKAKEEAETASYAKSEFLSRMSHEFRTPLNAILGFGQLMAMGDKNNMLSADHQNYLNLIMKGGRHLLVLVDEILDLSKIESGTLKVILEKIHLQTTIEEVVSFVQPLTKKKGILLENNLNHLPDVYIQADMIRLRQVFINVISNAIKFNCDEGRVVLSGMKQDSGWVSVQVSDTGCGIPKEKLNEVFEPFRRFESHSNNVEGVGIGLSITKHLVEMMGGKIHLESVLDEGSIFTLEFPLGSIDNIESEPSKEASH